MMREDNHERLRWHQRQWQFQQRGKEYWPRAALKYFDALKDEVTTAVRYNQEDRVSRATILPKSVVGGSPQSRILLWHLLSKKEAGHSAWKVFAGTNKSNTGESTPRQSPAQKLAWVFKRVGSRARRTTLRRVRQWSLLYLGGNIINVKSILDQGITQMSSIASKQHIIMRRTTICGCTMDFACLSFRIDASSDEKNPGTTWDSWLL